MRVLIIFNCFWERSTPWNRFTPHPGAIPGDEASSIGVGFEAMTDGEIHVSEVSFARVPLNFFFLEREHYVGTER